MIKQDQTAEQQRRGEEVPLVGHQPPDAERGVYAISVAADLVGMGVQTLRLYETRGLIQPERTAGGTRRYSANDLERLRRIGDLLDAGLNLAGISMVLDLETENAELRAGQQEWLAPAPIRPPTSGRPASPDATTRARPKR